MKFVLVCFILSQSFSFEARASNADSIDLEPVGEWVLTIPFSSDSNFFLFDDEDGIVVKRKDKIGDTVVYVLRGKDSKLSSVLATKSVEYDSYTKNYMITNGPGDAKTYLINAKKTSPIVNNGKNNNNNNNRGRKRSNVFELQKHVGRITDLATDYECRTEPFTSDVGYETGHFSWGIDRIDQRSPFLDRQACFFSTSSSIVPDDQIVDVYVIDTGVENDPSFVLPVSYDYSYYDSGNVHSFDCNGHATHVAGLIASVTYGVSPWNVQIRSVKALDCQGKGDFASLTAAFLWIKQHKSSTRRSVINLSLGSNGGQSSSITGLIQDLWTNDGVFSVAAAGNYGESDCNVFPANVRNVISVGATDPKDEKASFSNDGPCTDVFAPGVSIISCDFEDPHGGSILSGTSMSTPIVTGALANWMYAYDSGQSSYDIKDAFFRHFTKNRINPTTITRDTPNFIVYVGNAPNSNGGESNGGNFNGGFFGSGSKNGKSLLLLMLSNVCSMIVFSLSST
jgi:subtilisin family serine protease